MNLKKSNIIHYAMKSPRIKLSIQSYKGNGNNITLWKNLIEPQDRESSIIKRLQIEKTDRSIKEKLKQSIKKNNSLKNLRKQSSCKILKSTQTLNNSPKCGLSIRKRIQIIRNRSIDCQENIQIKSQQLINQPTLKKQTNKLKLKIRNPFFKKMKLENEFHQSKIEVKQNSFTSENINNQIGQLLKYI